MIRPAVPDDARAVTALSVAAGMFPPEATAVPHGLMADYFSGQEAAGHLCVIDDEGDPLGAAYALSLSATDRTWELLMIAVHPDRQGQGRGAALMRHVEAQLRSRGQRLLLVQTSGSPDYALTRQFYLKCGYQEVTG